MHPVPSAGDTGSAHQVLFVVAPGKRKGEKHFYVSLWV